MNPSFLTLSIQKQNRIIQSAYKVFSKYEYRKASMSEIAAAGDISKSLLFYYFKNKQELYSYIWKLALEKLDYEEKVTKKIDNNDFFDRLYYRLEARCNLMKEYPWLQEFCLKACQETDPNIRELIQKDSEKMGQLQGKELFLDADLSKFKDNVDLRILYQEIIWVSYGYLKQSQEKNHFDLEQMKHDLKNMISQWKAVYYKK